MRRMGVLLNWLLAGVLVWAGVMKTLNPAAYAESIIGFRLVPWPVAVLVALYLPWLELVVAMGLLVPRWREGALWIATGLFTGFALLWAVTWARGIDASCGCFGGSGNGSAAWPLVRAILLAAVAGALLAKESTSGVRLQR